MTVNESKGLKKGTRVYWRGDPADSGTVTETSWDAVTIAWTNGQVASVHHGDMRAVSSIDRGGGPLLGNRFAFGELSGWPAAIPPPPARGWP
jgi:hypothetical protein